MYVSPSIHNYITSVCDIGNFTVTKISISKRKAFPVDFYFEKWHNDVQSNSRYGGTAACVLWKWRCSFSTQVRGFKPGRSSRIFQGEKILSTPSFGGEVKLSVSCRRFTACKRFLNATWRSGISGKIHRPFLAHIVPPLATRISGETTSGESWNV